MIEFNAVQVLDRFSLVTPLGIRFWDGVTNSIIADSLQTVTYPQINPNLRVQGFPNSQGVYVFRNLPGLRAVENGVGENNATFWSSPPVQLPYVVEVKDNAQRFLPFQISLMLPQHGLFALPCVTVGTPPTPTTLVPLFSAPARAVPGGLAVLHAELWDFNTKNPAAWVVMDVRVPGKTPFQGMSDGQGRITIFFPYPEPTDFAPDSAFDPPVNPPSPPPPPQLQGLPLADHQWTLEIHAHYKPPAQLPTLPNLCPTLTQAEATLLADINPASKKTLTQIILKYGQELVLRSTDSSKVNQPAPSVLWITPAA
jgi:hypothetical protein